MGRMSFAEKSAKRPVCSEVAGRKLFRRGGHEQASVVARRGQRDYDRGVSTRIKVRYSRDPARTDGPCR